MASQDSGADICCTAVMAIGGYNNPVPGSTEGYDLLTGTWHALAAMKTDRNTFQAVLLTDGRGEGWSAELCCAAILSGSFWDLHML